MSFIIRFDNSSREHPRLTRARALAQQPPSAARFQEIVAVLCGNPHDGLPEWPDEATLQDAVTEIDRLLDSWPWELRERHDVIRRSPHSTDAHPCTRLIRKLTLARWSDQRSADVALRSTEFSSLRSLILSRHENAVMLSEKVHLSSLRELSLYDVWIPPEEWPKMHRAAHLSWLFDLRISEYIFAAAPLRELLTGVMVRSVRALGLCSGTLPGARLSELLVHRALCAQLHTLNLSGNDIHSWHVGPLVEAHWLTNLTSLDLRCRNLDYIDAEAQQALRNAPQFAHTTILFDPPKKR